MKKWLRWTLLLTVILAGLAMPAQAAPQLDDVFPDTDIVFPGGSMGVRYVASAPGTLHIVACSEKGEETPVLEQAIEAGKGSVTWDAMLGDQPAAPGMWTLEVTLTDAAGERSDVQAVLVEVGAGEATASAPAADATLATDSEQKATPQVAASANEPHEQCYWQMNPDSYDVFNPDDQQRIWEIMMQPIIVLNADPKEHIYPLTSPDADASDPANYTGQLHGTTQGVHVLEEQGEWSLIEAYSNDGWKAPNEEDMRQYAGQRIQGWVRSSKLKTIKPNTGIALLIDKLPQRLYIFQNGAMIGELLVSTGFPTASQPFNETPAGEFLTDSWVGAFVNGKMTCNLAIRLNGGVLLHEVPHLPTADGKKNYEPFKKYLGQKASHGCIRIQQMKSNAGYNMNWLWGNLKKKAKVLIWDDAGRAVQPLDPTTELYYNPNGGQSYHSDQNCAAVKERFLPLTPISYADIYAEANKGLIPCYGCLPPPRVADPSEVIPDDIIGTGTGDL